ncbi:MAG: hypothetical protein WCC83_00305 [Candidatus Rickettsiella isopodorum]|jgi:hypothetical protein
MKNRPVSKKNVEKEPLARVTFDVPLALRKAFKIKATIDDREMKEAFYELMQGYVDGKFKLD